jgi:uncharacterized membrane protein
MKFLGISNLNVNISWSWKTFGIVLTVMLILDAFWLGWFAQPLYSEFLRTINPTNPRHPIRIIPAVLSYLIMAITLTLLVIPLVKQTVTSSSSRFIQSFIYGGLGWGLTAYGIYNMTNLATIGVYPDWIVPYDVLWGIFLGTTTAFIGSSY